MMNNPYKPGATPYGGGYPGSPPQHGGYPQAGFPQGGGYPQAGGPQGGPFTPSAQPGGFSPLTGGAQIGGMPTSPGGQLPLEQSYIENILRLNLGKVATIYMTFENNSEWNAKIFRGRLEAAGRDHIIISDPQTGMRYLLLMVNLDYVTFDEELNYTYPYASPVTRR